MTDPTISDHDVLARLGATGANLLGAGNEAAVYALGGNRVVRIMRPGSQLSDSEARAALLDEVAGSAATLRFRTPIVHSVDLIEGRVVIIEQRLPGEPVSTLLGRLRGVPRQRLLADYLETATMIQHVQINRPHFGPLFGDRSLRHGLWSDFARAHIARNVRRCPADLRAAVSAEMRTIWSEPERRALVHMDYFPANVLAEEDAVTAVLDFGASSILGDPRMEAWSAVAYLDPEISPAASDDDRAQAMAWLEAKGLASGYGQARRWLAASWSHATDDPALMAWCRRILLNNSAQV